MTETHTHSIRTRLLLIVSSILILFFLFSSAALYYTRIKLPSRRLKKRRNRMHSVSPIHLIQQRTLIF